MTCSCCSGERLLVEAEHTPSTFSVDGAELVHLDGSGKEVRADICDLVDKNCPPPTSTIAASDVDGCCAIKHDDGVGDTTLIRIGSSLVGAKGPRGSVPDLIVATTPLGPLPGSEMCASISVGCCGGGVEIRHEHSLSARDGYSGLVAVQPQYQIDGGSWATFPGTGRDEIAIIGFDETAEFSEYEFTDSTVVQLGPGTHEICARLDYFGNGPFPITAGGVSANAAALSLLTSESTCC